MSPDSRKLESLLAQILSQRPDVSRESLLKLIQEKKSKVGGGYLTDQGALFLVAADLGVTMNYNRSSTTKLADLSQELQNVTVEARVLAWGPPKVFVRKTDSKQGLRTRMVIYDETSTIMVNLWDSKSSFPLEGKGLRPGDPIRISNTYVRQSPDGSLALNVGEKSSLEILQSVDGTELSMVTPPEKRAVPPELVFEPARHLVLKGRVVRVGELRKSSFNRSDGSQGNLISFWIGSPSISQSTSEEYQQKPTRVVIWDNPNPVFLSLREGEEVTICNLRAKTASSSSNQSFGGVAEGGQDIELHGDETSSILEYWVETLHWIKSNAPDVSYVLSSHSSSSTSLSAHTGKPSSDSPIPFVARILSMGQRKFDGASVRVLVTDSASRKISVSLANEAMQGVESLAIDDVIVCKPDSIDHLSSRAVCSKKNSIVKTAVTRPDIPSSSKLVTSIEKLEEGSIVSLEVMSLAEAASREVQTKDGLVRRSELSVGDPTGEIKVYAWRDLSRLLEKIPAGERLWLRAVEAQIHEGKKFLVLKNYSRVELESS